MMLFAVSLVVLPAFTFGWIASSRSRASLEHVIGLHLAREARQTADRLDAAIQAERDALLALSNQDLMRDLRVDDIDRRVARALAKLTDASASRVAAVVLDTEGRVVAASAPDWLDQGRLDPGRVPSDEPTTIEIRRDCPGLGGPCLLVTANVPNPDRPGETIGSLLGVYDWLEIASITKSVETELSELGLRTRVDVLADEPAKLASGRADFIVDEAGGWLIGRAKATGEPSPGVRVAVALPDARRPVQRMARALGLAGAIALALAMLGALVGASRLVQPLTELTDATRSLATPGAGRDRVPVRSQDELGELAGAFNQMADDLDRAQEELVDAAKLSIVGRVAAGVAHEVRTSLGVLRSSSQVLERSAALKQDPRAAELVHMGRVEVDRLARVVNDLLNLARPREPKLQCTDLRSPVFRAADFVESQARARGIVVARAVSDDDTSTVCDPELVYQAVLNLLVNALQVHDGPGGRVDVRVFGGDDAVGFEVEDDGPGVPAGLRASLFEPFVTERAGGIGLGLAFVKRVVQQHGGQVELTSAEGQGACFRVLLPRSRSEA